MWTQHTENGKRKVRWEAKMGNSSWNDLGHPQAQHKPGALVLCCSKHPKLSGAPSTDQVPLWSRKGRVTLIMWPVHLIGRCRSCKRSRGWTGLQMNWDSLQHAKQAVEVVHAHQQDCFSGGYRLKDCKLPLVGFFCKIRGTPKPRNYLLERGPLVVQASAARWVF